MSIPALVADSRCPITALSVAPLPASTGPLPTPETPRSRASRDTPAKEPKPIEVGDARRSTAPARLRSPDLLLDHERNDCLGVAHHAAADHPHEPSGVCLYAGNYISCCRRIRTQSVVSTGRYPSWVAEFATPPYLSADLTDRYAHGCRAIDVCGLTPSANGELEASFWHWDWDPAPRALDVRVRAEEFSAARCSMLDGPQGLARPGQSMRACDRAAGAPAKVPDQRPELSRSAPDRAPAESARSTLG